MAYKGVGQKTAEAAVQAFGADGIFDALQNHPDRVTEKLGARRAQPLIDGFAAQQAKPARGARKSAGKRATSKNGRGGTKRGRSRSGTSRG